VGAAAVMAAGGVARAQAPARPASPARRFKLKYAFDAGQFSNHAPGGVVDELKFAADRGFVAMQDGALSRRPVDEQEKIAREMQRLNMTMGIFAMNDKTGLAAGGTLTTGKVAHRDAYLAEVKQSIDLAKRVNARWLTALVGNADAKLPLGYQFANVVDCLRRASDILEPHGLVMVHEPRNTSEDHPGFFIHSNDQMYAMMKAVRSPSCKLLYDFYQSQMSEGHLIYNFDRCYDEIGYLQTGDVPGRNEPGTGEINHRNLFAHIYRKGYQGLIGMKHGKSKPGKAGELALIASYRDADNF